MKNKKIVFVLLIIFTLMSLLTITVNAADSFSAKLTPNTTRVSKGEEVTVTLKLEKINVQDGISVVEGTLKFDSDILSISKSDIKASDGWAIEYNEDNNKFEIDRSDSITEDSDIATFKFKVNDGTSASTAMIQIDKMAAGNSTITEKISISAISTNITITGGSSLQPSTSPSVSPSTVPTTSPSTAPTVSVAPTATPTQPTTKKETDMPYTGTEDYILPLIAIIAILGIASFVGYKKIEK